jgi:hypothetical protein
VPKQRRGNRRGILESEGTSVPIDSVGEAISSTSRQGVGQRNPTGTSAAAGLRTVAVPNPGYPPHVDVLRQGDFAINGPADLTVDVIDRLDHGEGSLERHLDEEEAGSFPASDPHSDWVGPPN